MGLLLNFFKTTSKCVALSTFITGLLSASQVYNPILRHDIEGTTIAIWEEEAADGLHSIQAANYSDTTWRDKELISESGLHSYNPLVAMNTSGSIAVLWLGIDPEQKTAILYGKMRSTEGIWGPVHSISQSDEVIDESSIRLCMDDNGSTIVTWKSYLPAENVTSLFTASGTPSTYWTDAEQVFP